MAEEGRVGASGVGGRDWDDRWVCAAATVELRLVPGAKLSGVL